MKAAVVFGPNELRLADVINFLPDATLVIDAREPRRYIQTLADYEIDCGPLTPETGVWPCPALEVRFRELCREAYQATRDLVERARAQQESRSRRGPG